MTRITCWLFPTKEHFNDSLDIPWGTSAALSGYWHPLSACPLAVHSCVPFVLSQLPFCVFTCPPSLQHSGFVFPSPWRIILWTLHGMWGEWVDICWRMTLFPQIPFKVYSLFLIVSLGFLYPGERYVMTQELLPDRIAISSEVCLVQFCFMYGP